MFKNMKQKWKRVISLFIIFFLAFYGFLNSNIRNSNVSKVLAVTSDTLTLSPVNSKDVVYQIITDRFYDGDKNNNVPGGVDKKLFDGSGNDLKLYQGGDYKGIIDKIPYLKEMGITAVWISAPYENRDEAILDYQSNGSINTWTSFHGYHVRNYFATNKHFGTLNEFKELRDALHINGMKLIIDFVTNHTSRWQNPTKNFIKEDGKLYEPDKLPNGNYAFDKNGEPYDYNKDGFIENLIADPNNDKNGWFHGLGDRGINSTRFGYRFLDLGSLADFSQENKEVVNYLEKAVKYWTSFGIEGLRHDATLHMNPAFMKGLKDAVDSESTITHFGEFFIGRPDSKYKEYTSYPERTGVNNLDFEYYRAATSTFGNFQTSMSDFGKMLTYTEDDYKNSNQAVTFLDNHDVTRFGYLQQNHKTYNSALAVLLTSRGIPNIYYGTEQYVKSVDASDVAGRVFMQKETSFNQQSKAYKIISKLSKLRQSNDAVAYGTTTVLYSNKDVLVYDRTFSGNHVVVAVNREPNAYYTVSGVETNMPVGTYSDALNGLLSGSTNSVQKVNGKNEWNSFTLEGGEVCIWEYKNKTVTTPRIGDVISTMGRAGNKVYIYGEGFNKASVVKFDSIKAKVISVTDSIIETLVPDNAKAGENQITVVNEEKKLETTNSNANKSKGAMETMKNIKSIKLKISNPFSYQVLSGDQNQIIFHVKANTKYGENIYVVGNIPELGSWDVTKCSEEMLSPNYPEWFLPVSVPAGTKIEFKFIKKDSYGNIIWESSSNRVITSSSNRTGVIDTKTYTWSEN